MTPLRKRMLEDMQIRNLAQNTQASYLQQVGCFARHFGKSPEALGPEEVPLFLGCISNRKARTVLTVCYAAGLRISAAIALVSIDIDSQRMILAVDLESESFDQLRKLPAEVPVLLAELGVLGGERTDIHSLQLYNDKPLHAIFESLVRHHP